MHWPDEHCHYTCSIFILPHNWSPTDFGTAHTHQCYKCNYNIIAIELQCCLSVCCASTINTPEIFLIFCGLWISYSRTILFIVSSFIHFPVMLKLTNLYFFFLLAYKWPGPVFALCDCKDLRDWWEIRLCSFRCRCLPKTPVFKRKKIKHQAGYICLAAVYMLKYCLVYPR